MRKIAEQKALEAFPIPKLTKVANQHHTQLNKERRRVYRQGYNQAMKDFMEYLEHCSTFTDMYGNTRIDNDLFNTLIEDFKKYMQNENNNLCIGIN